MYIGSTTQSIDERMNQHFNDDGKDKFHQWSRNIDRDNLDVKPIYDVEVETNNMFEEPIKFTCWGDIEDFEMELVQKYNPLNTRRKTNRQEIVEIKEPELKDTLTKEEYDKIKYYKKEEKEIIPHFDDISGSKIRLRFYYNGEKYEKKLGYVKIGYEKAKDSLETYFNDKIQELKTKDEIDSPTPCIVDVECNDDGFSYDKDGQMYITM